MGSKKNGSTRSALRRQREKELRRSTILTAAEKLFAQKGYRKTRIEDIADIAEISVGSVYGHFKNKEDLLIGVLDDIGMYTRKLARNAFMEGDSILDGIERAGIAFFEELCLPYPEKIRLLFDESIGFSDHLIDARRNFMEKVTGDVHNALMQAKHGAGLKYSSGLSGEVIAVCITSIYAGLGNYYKFWKKQPEDTMAIGAEVVRYIVGGIKSLIVSNEERL
ncbi:MAG: TetR/AcrR family transcriptional regulator [Proteobacteria bacterium]|nr:TetR/AcrR family transcriptional regulator [Pseudomonadota bacterium]